MGTSLTIDELVVLINAETKEFKRQVAQINDQLEGIDKQAGKMSKTSAAAFGVVAGAAQALVNKGINLITSSIGSAVSRVDTLKNSSRVFQNMGFSAQDTKKNMDFLNESIKGLPTGLDDAVRGVQALASVQGDLGSSVKTYKALNDGILAFGGSAEMVNGAVLQLSQLPMDGPLDAQTWNSLRQNGLTPVFAAMAKESKMSISELKEAFGKGELTVQDFTTKLIELDEKGGGGMASLSKQARDATDGIKTGWTNMQTAISRGIADIANSIGSKNISNAISNLGKAFEDGLSSVSDLIKFIKNNSAVFGTLAAAIGGATAALISYRTYVTISTAVAAAFAAVSTYLSLVVSLQAQGLGLLRAAWLALNITMAANPIGIIIVAVAALVAALVYFFTQTELGRQIFSAAMDAIKTAAIFAWEAIKTAWSAIEPFFNTIFGVVKGIFEFYVKSYVAIYTAAWNTIKAVWSVMSAVFEAIFNAVKAVVEVYIKIYVALFTGAWNAVKAVWNTAVGFFSSIWAGIQSVFSAVVGWFGSVFRSAYNSVTSIFSGLYGFFSGVWSRIVGLFGNVGTSVGNAIGGAFKSVVNSILNQVANIINGVINTINGAIGAINKLPGVNVGKIGKISVPHLASGGIIPPGFPGDTFPAMLSSGEAVIPLDELDNMTGTSHIVVKIGEDTIVDKIVNGINNRSFMLNETVIEV